jgi:hypothetical protein
MTEEAPSTEPVGSAQPDPKGQPPADSRPMLDVTATPFEEPTLDTNLREGSGSPFAPPRLERVEKGAHEPKRPDPPKKG